jgi:hypothetical protein
MSLGGHSSGIQPGTCESDLCEVDLFKCVTSWISCHKEIMHHFGQINSDSSLTGSKSEGLGIEVVTDVFHSQDHLVFGNGEQKVLEGCRGFYCLKSSNV